MLTRDQFSITNLEILLTCLTGPMQEWDTPGRIRRRTRVSVKDKLVCSNWSLWEHCVYDHEV
jgi:hypothetical protein